MLLVVAVNFHVAGRVEMFVGAVGWWSARLIEVSSSPHPSSPHHAHLGVTRIHASLN